MSDAVPVPPTPPIPPAWRSLIYAVWAWGSLILSTSIVTWEMIESAPKALYAVSVGWTFFGSGVGFMANNNVRDKIRGNVNDGTTERGKQ